MYEKFFALSHRPFAAAPNLECIVAHEGYVAAREKLQRCLVDGSGAAVLTAPAGLGKSLLCQDLQARLRGQFTVAYLCSAQFPNRKAMLQAILFELGAEYLGLSEDEARLCVMKAAQAAADRGRGLIIIVDEAHLISTELLQELRMLSEPSSRCSIPARLLLCGQLELEERLADHELDAVNQRIACHAVLEPLTLAESAEYIHERLAMAGAKTGKFTQDALEFIVKAADGNPRAIHQLCDHCLLSAYTIEEKPISLETARNALEDLRALPLHWNDSGLLDTDAEPVDEIADDAEEDEFVATTDSGSVLEAGHHDAVDEEADVHETAPLPVWETDSTVGVFEIGGTPAPVTATPSADAEATESQSIAASTGSATAEELRAPVESVVISEANGHESAEREHVPSESDVALFASTAPWPAVPVHGLGMSLSDTLLNEIDEVEFESTTDAVTSEALEEIESLLDAAAARPVDHEEPAWESLEERTIEATSELAAAPSSEATIDAAAEEESAANELEGELDECEEEAVECTSWRNDVEFVDELEADDFEDEELIISDRYAALDRASESLSACFPKAPELLQFLSQYSVREQSRRDHEPAAMHQSAIEVAEPETDSQEEELLATIRELQEQLRKATVERPKPIDPADAWKEGAEPVVYDIVEPPVTEPVSTPVSEPAPVVEIRPAAESMITPESAPAVQVIEPAKSRFAQLFSRMRKRRREVEDRLRRNVDWP